MSAVGRVLFIIGTGERGGRELQLGTLAPRLAEAGWEVGVVFFAAGGPIADRLQADGIWVRTPRHDWPGTKSRNPLLLPLTAARLARAALFIRAAARDFRPDVVHAMLPMSVWLGLPVVQGLGAGAVAGVYGQGPSRRQLDRFLYGRVLRRADAVLCNAPHLVGEMVAKYRVAQDRVRWIANGVTVPPNTADTSAQPPGAVVVANFHPKKGYDVLLEALAMVEAPVTVRCCGVGTAREPTRAQARGLGLIDVAGAIDRIQFVEAPADVPTELTKAQFALHPSRTEGLSNAILEELAHGLPVVACTVGGNVQLVEDGVNGLLVPPGDAPALASAITRLALDPELRGRMGSAARANAGRYSWETCVQGHVALYEGLHRGQLR